MTAHAHQRHVEVHAQMGGCRHDTQLPCRCKAKVVYMTMQRVCCCLCVGAKQEEQSAGGCSPGRGMQKSLTRNVSHVKEGCMSSNLSLSSSRGRGKELWRAAKKSQIGGLANTSPGPGGPQQKRSRDYNQQWLNPRPSAPQLNMLPLSYYCLSSSC